MTSNFTDIPLFSKTNILESINISLPPENNKIKTHVENYFTLKKIITSLFQNLNLINLTNHYQLI